MGPRSSELASGGDDRGRDPAALRVVRERAGSGGWVSRCHGGAKLPFHSAYLETEFSGSGGRPREQVTRGTEAKPSGAL